MLIKVLILLYLKVYCNLVYETVHLSYNQLGYDTKRADRIKQNTK